MLEYLYIFNWHSDPPMSPSQSGDLSAQKPRVFISHSHIDQVYVRRIYAWLENVGFNPWASFEECSDLFRVEIDNALLECDIFLLVASKDAFESVEVRREITSAGSQNKKISYYKLDEASHNLAGFLTLLSEKQYVQASRNNLELEKLALNIYESFDGNKDERIRQSRNNLIRSCFAVENENYHKWREKLWSLRLDSSNSQRKLSSADRDILKDEANRLGIIVSIDDENQSYSLNKQSFSRDLIGIIAKRKIDKSMLSQIEKKRLECYVSKGLAVNILLNRLNKIDYLSDISISKSAEKTDHWLVTEIKRIKIQKLALDDNKRAFAISNRKNEPSKTFSFRFRHRICPLERYVNGGSDTKMHVLSIELVDHHLRFDGIKGMTPFYLVIPISIQKITADGDVLRIHQLGLEEYIVLRIDRTSTEYDQLLKFLTKATGRSFQPAIAAPNSSRVQLKNEDHVAPKETSKPDKFFYGLIALAVTLLTLAFLIGKLYTGLLSLF